MTTSRALTFATSILATAALTIPILSRSRRTSTRPSRWPRISTVPRVGWRYPDASWSRVVFPDPLGPTMAQRSLLSTTQSTSRRIGASPRTTSTLEKRRAAWGRSAIGLRSWPSGADRSRTQHTARSGQQARTSHTLLEAGGGDAPRAERERAVEAVDRTTAQVHQPARTPLDPDGDLAITWVEHAQLQRPPHPLQRRHLGTAHRQQAASGRPVTRAGRAHDVERDPRLVGQRVRIPPTGVDAVAHRLAAEHLRALDGQRRARRVGAVGHVFPREHPR